jgi:hypothetical protein
LSLWVAVGQGTTHNIATSPDGITWTGLGTSIFGAGNRGQSVAWNGALWVAVGSGTNTIGYSRDGINWTGLGKSIFSSNSYGVIWSSSQSLWVAVGSGTNTIATSPDGITWTGRGTSIISGTGLAIASDDNQLVRLDNTTNNSIQFATDSYYQEGYSNITITVASTTI